MVYAQLSGQTGLRGIETALDSIKNLLYHLGVKKIKRSTLSYANNNRPSTIYQDVFNKLLSKILKMKRTHKHRFNNPQYSVDATTIDLCLSLFPWATSRKTTANKHEVHSLKDMEF